MKVWTRVTLNDQDRNSLLISKSLTNYIYGYGPINEICKKYGVSDEDRMKLDRYTTNRIAGILMLYLANDVKRINDIVNKYNVENQFIQGVLPEIEGYINK